jgi:hypothetical protein
MCVAAVSSVVVGKQLDSFQIISHTMKQGARGKKNRTIKIEISLNFLQVGI